VEAVAVGPVTGSARPDRVADYLEVVSRQLQAVAEREAENLRDAAAMVARALQEGHLVYTFGSGHSRFIAGELTWRAGGLAPVVAIEDPGHGAAERVEGYAITFLEAYDVEAGDVVFVVSQSGINAVPIETAVFARERGAYVIAVTSLAHAGATASRHSAGKKLHELADLVLDTHTAVGDAAVALDGGALRVAPTSTVVSTAMLNAAVAQAAQLLLDAGVVPPVLVSANVSEGDTHNRRLADKLWRRLTHFPRRGSSSAA